MIREDPLQFERARLRDDLARLRDDLRDGDKVTPFGMSGSATCMMGHIAARRTACPPFREMMEADPGLRELFAVQSSNGGWNGVTATRLEAAAAIDSYLKTGRPNYGRPGWTFRVAVRAVGILCGVSVSVGVTELAFRLLA